MQFGVTEQGFVLKTYSDILKSMEEKLKTKFGLEWEFGIYTPEGAIIAITANEISKAWEGIKQAYFSAYLDSSTGIQLDYHGKDEEPPVPRSQGKYSVTTLEFITDREMSIPKNTLVKKRDTELTYMTTQNLTVGRSFKGEVQAVATEYGSDYNSIIGEISELVNNIVGVVSVSNTTPASGGEGIEKDIYYRERIRTSRQSKGGSTSDTITAELLKSETINNALVLENTTDEIDLNGIKPGHIRAYIDGVDSEEVAKIIHKYKSAGIESEGDRIYKIENSGGQVTTERFYMMTKVQFYIKINITDTAAAGTVTEQLKSDIKNVIIDYIESIQKGGMKSQARRIVVNQIESRAYSVSNNILELNATVGLSPNPVGTANVDIPIGEYYYCDADTIEVVG